MGPIAIGPVNLEPPAASGGFWVCACLTTAPDTLVTVVDVAWLVQPASTEDDRQGEKNCKRGPGETVQGRFSAA